jgi:hypothetical protein
MDATLAMVLVRIVNKPASEKVRTLAAGVLSVSSMK